MRDTPELISPTAVESTVEPRAEGDAAMFCSKCGTRNTDDANYCRKCGRRVDIVRSPIDEEEFALLQRPEDRVSDLLAVAFKRRERGDLDGASRACASALQIMPDSTTAH